jgi:hypothetical protein
MSDDFLTMVRIELDSGVEDASVCLVRTTRLA